MAVYEVTKWNRTSELASPSKRSGTKHKGVARTFNKVIYSQLSFIHVRVFSQVREVTV